MTGARGLMLFVALVGLAGSLAACGQTVGYPGPVPPAHTRPYPNASASPLPAGVDAMATLLARPMRPPSPDSGRVCWASSTNQDIGPIAPNYGAGAGPAYLSGQTAWYAGGEVAVLMIDARYSGPLMVRPFQLGGDGRSQVILDVPPDLLPSNPGISDKERSHGVTAVEVQSTPAGGMFVAAALPSTYWRAAFSMLGTTGPGCFGLQVDGDGFTEFIVFEVNPGSAPPG